MSWGMCAVALQVGKINMCAFGGFVCVRVFSDVKLYVHCTRTLTHAHTHAHSHPGVWRCNCIPAELGVWKANGKGGCADQ